MNKGHMVLLVLAVLLLIPLGAFGQSTYEVSKYDIGAKERIVELLMYSGDYLYLEATENAWGPSDLWKINLRDGVSTLVLKAKGNYYAQTGTRIFYGVPDGSRNKRTTKYTIAFYDLLEGKEHILDRDSASLELSPDGEWLGYYYSQGYKLLNLSNRQAFTFSGLRFETYWSQDNPRVARLCDETHLEIVDVSQRSLATYLALEGYVVEDYRWSPDGQRLAVILRATKGNASDLVVFDLNGSAKTLYSWGDRLFYPTWSPDGEKLAVFVGKNRVFNAAILDLRGNIIRWAGTDTIDPGDFIWAPNSHDFAYLKHVDGQLFTLWFGSTDNEKDVSPLAEGIKGYLGSPWLWSHDSRKFFISVNGAVYAIAR